MYFVCYLVWPFCVQASFNVSENRTDIDINDPNFWQKWAKKADLDVDTMTNKVMNTSQQGNEL